MKCELIMNKNKKYLKWKIYYVWILNSVHKISISISLMYVFRTKFAFICPDIKWNKHEYMKRVFFLYICCNQWFHLKILFAVMVLLKQICNMIYKYNQKQKGKVKFLSKKEIFQFKWFINIEKKWKNNWKNTFLKCEKFSSNSPAELSINRYRNLYVHT